MVSKKRLRRRPVKAAEVLNILALRASGMSVKQISAETKRAPSTIFKVLADARQAPPAPPLIVVPEQEQVQEKPAFMQRMAIKLCRFFGVTDNMYKHN